MKSMAGQFVVVRNELPEVIAAKIVSAVTGCVHQAKCGVKRSARRETLKNLAADRVGTPGEVIERKRDDWSDISKRHASPKYDWQPVSASPFSLQ
jgi:hypothetical protein